MKQQVRRLRDECRVEPHAARADAPSRRAPLAAALLAAALALPSARAVAQDAAGQVQDTAAQDAPAPDAPAPDAPAPDAPAPDAPAPDAPAPDAPAPDAPAPDAPAPETPAPDAPVPVAPAPETMTETTVTTETDTTIRMEDPAATRPGDPVTGDKSDYTLTNPTPRSMMRPLSADRPDVTESPYTVDAGHFQVEASFFEYARDAGGAVTEFSLLPFIAKVGLTSNIDLELGMQPFVDVDIDGGRIPVPGGGFVSAGGGSSGFGPILLRAKINLWGNDGGGAPFDLPDNFPDSLRERWGDSAFALLPYVRFPTGNDDIGPDEVEFGLAAPLQTPITDDWDLGLMGDLAFVRSDGDGSYKLEFLHTASFYRNLGGRLNGYGEYIGVLTGSEGTRYLASVGIGLVYELTRDLQVDAAINVGLNEDAEDFRFLTGFTWRR